MEISVISALRAQRVVEASPSLTSTPRTRKAEMPEMPSAEVKPHRTDCQGFAKGARQSAERKKLSESVRKAAETTLVESRAEQLERFNEADLAIARALRERAEQMMVKVESPADLRALAGAIEPADGNLVRARQHAHPVEEWAQLLDWCEAAAPERAAGARKAGACAGRRSPR